MLPYVIAALVLSVTPSEAGPSCSSRPSGPEAQHRYPPLLVFASLSMPKPTLQLLAKHVHAVGGAVVLRGLVDGDMKKTALALQDLGQPVLIDPTLLRAYRVHTVPTFILRTTHTDRADQAVPHDRLSGNVSLDHALETFAKEGATAQQAHGLLKRMRRKG